MDVDEPGTHSPTLGVDDPLGLSAEVRSNSGDAAVADGHVGPTALTTGPIDDPTAADQRFVHERRP